MLCCVVVAGFVAGAGVAFGVVVAAGFGAGAGVAFGAGAGAAAFDHSVVLPCCARPVLSDGRKKNIPAPKRIRTKIPTERIVHKSFCCSILFPFLKYFYYFLSSFFTAAYITYSKNIGI